MKFFIDTADINAIREANAMGLVDGVTTNPSLIAKVGGKPVEVLKEICNEVSGPVSAEVIATDAEGMIREARELAKIADNIVVKIPLITEGLKATRALREEGIDVNVTLCFNALQALLAAKAGATFVSPFIGRLDDIAHVGMDLIREIRTIYDNYGFETEIITRSVWAGSSIREVLASCRYFEGEQRVTHFKVRPDTARHLVMHARLLARALWPWPHKRLFSAASAEPAMSSSGEDHEGTETAKDTKKRM